MSSRRPTHDASAAYGVVPTGQEILKKHDRGMSHQDIVDEIERLHGVKVTTNAVSMSLRRAGVQLPPQRYDDVIPWSPVAMRHQHKYPITMLRLEGRIRRGLELRPREARRLELWKKMLDEKGWVVDYDPEDPDGFVYRPRREGEEGLVRRPEDKKTMQDA